MAMNKRKSPWIWSDDQLPPNGARVVVDYVTKEGKSLFGIGYMRNRTGWMLHETFPLPEGWQVVAWLPIPENTPF